MSKTENTEEQLKIVLEHYKAKITSKWDDGCDVFFYEESTADGYAVFVATENDKNPNINEDVYYYESDWFEKLPDAIKEGKTVFIEENYLDEAIFTDAISEVYEDCYEEYTKATQEVAKKSKNDKDKKTGKKFCTNCGNEVTGEKFCSSCGAKTHESKSEENTDDTMKEADVKETENLTGKSIVISGVFDKYSRKELKAIIEERGGKVSSSVSKNTSFILAGTKMGPSKKQKAKDLNSEMIGVEDFIKRFNQKS